MFGNTLVFVSILCVLGLVSSQDANCPASYEYKDCGSPCTITCDNYEDPPFCLAVCQSGCFCPDGTAEHNGTCISTNDCPSDTSNCPASYEYNDCGSPCTITCDNYEDPPFCLAACQSGCFCPDGTAEHNGTCILTNDCPSDTPSCAASYEYKDCGSPCTITCDNYEDPPFCLAACQPGCFCPDGTAEHNGTCISTDDCPPTTPSCPESYEYLECGSPCTKTCDNYNEDIDCATVCSSGCFCPEGTVDHNEMCILTDECPDDGSVCTGGKEWQDCGTACPLTCDNYDNPPLACTFQCVQGCFCPDGKADLDGVCVESSTCAGCEYCREGQTCTAILYEDYEYTDCKDPVAVPCSGPYLPCPRNSQCVTHIVTGDSFCLESCYLGNGGCPDDQVCYYERVDEECDQLLEPCFKTACKPAHAVDPDSCPTGWEMNPCGSLCQRTCKDYVAGDHKACIEICAPPDCVCPQGMVVFRDRCVDPLECYSLLTDEPDINPLPMPEDTVLLAVTLVNVETEDVDGAQFALDVEALIAGLGFEDIDVSLYATVEDEDGNAVIVLSFEGESIEREKTAEVLIEIVIENAGELRHEVADVHSVDPQSRVGDDRDRDHDEDEDDDEDDNESPSDGVIAGVAVALVMLCCVLVAIVIVIVAHVVKSRKLKQSAMLELEKTSYTEFATKEEMT